MGLERHHVKRTVTTRAPAPLVRAARPLRFVVHRHEGDAPHFDFRLEIDGVLKCWSMPREPDAQSEEKRLALQVEDVPLEQDPGAQPWDAGEWIPEGDALTAHRRGRLHFALKGRRLKGRWSLVRMGNAQTRTKDLWVLVKREGP